MVGIINAGGAFAVVLLGLLKNQANVANLKLFLLLLNLIVIITGIGVILFDDSMLVYILMTFGFFLAFSFATVLNIICFTHIGMKTTPHLIGKVLGLAMAAISITMVASNYLCGWALGFFINDPGLVLVILPTLFLILSLFAKKVKEDKIES
jgi:hypothetical protein